MDKSFRKKMTESKMKHSSNSKASIKSSATASPLPSTSSTKDSSSSTHSTSFTKNTKKSPTKSTGSSSSKKNLPDPIDDLITRMLKESNEKSKRYFESRLNEYVDQYFDLMLLNFKLNKLMGDGKEIGGDGGGSSSSGTLFDLWTDIDSSEDDDLLSFLAPKSTTKSKSKTSSRGGGRSGFKWNPFKVNTSSSGASTTKASTSSTGSSIKKPRQLQKGFTLYNQYFDGTSKLKLDDGVFTVQIDVGGSKDQEILIDSNENHLTIKSKDCHGEKHVFGIVCPTVEDVDKLMVHYPKDGLLKIDGPTSAANAPAKSNSKKSGLGSEKVQSQPKMKTAASASTSTN